jgi:3-isopropylmalate/(R)-2-methylmalate dehydratase small subunit
MAMEPFIKLTALAVPLDEQNIDTNQICPTRFNKVPRGPKYAEVLFHDLRFNEDGTEKPFILNREPYRQAKIVVADTNFGCGSSRESAVYALYEFGIRCVIAPSFGDIFTSNSFKNGLLPVVLSQPATASIRAQLREQPGGELTVDLFAQTVTDAVGEVHSFQIHPVRKKCLLEGLNDIARTDAYRAERDRFEAVYRVQYPWLCATTPNPASAGEN